MKVLFLSAASSIHTVKWVNSLVSRGHVVHLVFNEGHNPRENYIDNRVILHCLKYGGTKGYYLNARELKKLCEVINPDVINVHYASGYGTLARWSQISPILLSIWGSDVYDFPYQSKIKKLILKKNVRYATKIASTSFCMAEQLRKVMDNKKLEIEVTPFGVDLQFFDPTKYEKEVSSCIRIGNIKALEEKYGIEEFIRGISELLKRLECMEKQGIKNKIQVDIYGSGSQKDKLQILIRELQLENFVHLKGRVANEKVPQILKNFTIFCATSKLDSESFGVAVVEAMAMEVPVIVTDVDGFKEVVVNNETGLIIERNSITQIADALEQLVNDENKRKIYGRNGRKRVEELYCWKDNVSRMESIYYKMISEKENAK